MCIRDSPDNDHDYRTVEEQEHDPRHEVQVTDRHRAQEFDDDDDAGVGVGSGAPVGRPECTWNAVQAVDDVQ